MALIIKNDDFWTDIDQDDFLTTFPVPSNYKPAQVTQQLAAAMVKANYDLTPIKTALLAANYLDFDSYVSSNESAYVDEKDTRVFMYITAVYSMAKIKILNLSPAIGRSIDAKTVAEPDAKMASDLLENYKFAIAYIFNRLNLAQNPTISAENNSAITCTLI